MVSHLARHGVAVNRKKMQRMLRILGLQSILPQPRTTVRAAGHPVYPYLLRGVEITRPNQVWACDITYVPLQSGYLYLTAVLDWFSRHVLSWRLSNSMDVEFCLEALDEALCHGRPEIFNTDQGSQFTSAEFTGRLTKASIAISMDGKGRAIDNVMIERLWRTVKYENIYVKDYATGADCHQGLTKYFRYYGHERPHTSLSNQTPWEAYQSPRRTRR